MFRRAAGVACALCAGVLLGGCGVSPPPVPADEQPQPLHGGALTFSVAGQRFALAAFTPPASMVVVRTGPLFFWATPSPSLRAVYLEDVIEGRPAGSHVLNVNAAGIADYTYALDWGR